MQTKTFTVPAIHCDHCTHTIQMEVGELAGVQRVEASTGSKQVTVAWETPATWQKIAATLREINYPPQELIQLD